MKNLLYTLFFCLLLVGCGREMIVPETSTPSSTENSQENTELQTDSNHQTPESNEETVSQESESDNNTIKNDSSHENTANNNKESRVTTENLYSRITYPSFQGITNEQQVNQLILSYVTELDNLYNYDDSSTLTASYQIMFQNDHYLSIYFTGDISGGAYPSVFKSTLNIDLTKASKLPLSHIVNLDSHFIDMTTTAFQEQFNSIGVTMEDALPLGLQDKLENADSEITADIQSYFTSNEVVIILSVQHALGDYITIKIPKTSIENFLI